MEDRLFDGHLALSSWYGRAHLEDHGYGDAPQYPISVSQPFSFYGASAQIGGAMGIKLNSNSVLDLGFRCGAAYEDGPYRAFRAKATARSRDIVDCCPSGWSGNFGIETALIYSARKNLDFRFGILPGMLFTDLPSYFGGKWEGFSPLTPTIQSSIAVRYEKMFFSIALITAFLSNSGLSCAFGYVLF